MTRYLMIAAMAVMLVACGATPTTTETTSSTNATPDSIGSTPVEFMGQTYIVFTSPEAYRAIFGGNIADYRILASAGCDTLWASLDHALPRWQLGDPLSPAVVSNNGVAIAAIAGLARLDCPPA